MDILHKQFERTVLKPEGSPEFYPEGYGLRLLAKERVDFNEFIEKNISEVMGLVRKWGVVLFEGVGEEGVIRNWKTFKRTAQVGWHADGSRASFIGMPNSFFVRALFQTSHSITRPGETLFMPADVFWQSKVLAEIFRLRGSVSQRLVKALFIQEFGWGLDVDVSRRVTEEMREKIVRVKWDALRNPAVVLWSNGANEDGIKTSLHAAMDDVVEEFSGYYVRNLR